MLIRKTTSSSRAVGGAAERGVAVAGFEGAGGVGEGGDVAVAVVVVVVRDGGGGADDFFREEESADSACALQAAGNIRTPGVAAFGGSGGESVTLFEDVPAIVDERGAGDERGGGAGGELLFQDAAA